MHYCPDYSRLYPEVYYIVYPVVREKCAKLPCQICHITKDVFEQMVNEITEECSGKIMEMSGVDFIQSIDESSGNVGKINTSKISRNRLFRDLTGILLLGELFRRGLYYHSYPYYPYPYY